MSDPYDRYFTEEKPDCIECAYNVLKDRYKRLSDKYSQLQREVYGESMTIGEVQDLIRSQREVETE